MAPRTRRTTLAAALALLLPVAAGCAGEDGGGGSVSAPDEPVTAITITSPNLSFDIESFEVPVGEPVTITYENADRGVLHNIHVDTGGGDDDPQTELVEGVATRELTFTLDEAGEHTYLCDLHPAQMRGTITAVEA